MKKRLNQYVTPVFWISISVISIVVLLGIAFFTKFESITTQVRNFISNYFGWYYLLLVTGIVFFCVFLIASPVGQIRLGDPDSKPDPTPAPKPT